MLFSGTLPPPQSSLWRPGPHSSCCLSPPSSHQDLLLAGESRWHPQSYKTRLKQPSPQLVRRTENAGLLFKAKMNGEYANHRLPRSSGRGGPTAGRPTPLHQGLSHESVCIPAAASGTRPGWGCSHRKTKISFRPKQNEALAGPGRLLDVVHTDPLRAPITWILTESTTFPEGAGGRPLRPLRKESTASGQGGRDQEMGSAHSEAPLFCPFQK